MSAVKFVHVLKRIEALDRDINEIHALTEEIKSDRSYATPIKISLEQQVNNMLAERTKLMEVRIENPPENLDPTKRKVKDPYAEERPQGEKFSFEILEKEYNEWVDEKRSGYGSSPRQTRAYEESAPEKALAPRSYDERLDTHNEHNEEEKKSVSKPSLAEKSLLPGKTKQDDNANAPKKRSDLLKDLPPLEY